MKQHHYAIELQWTGNQGTGTSDYRAYSRNHVLRGEGKPEIPGSSDPTFRGDRSRYNPEEMLVAALSSCHMLWYLHLCAEAGVVVESYEDSAQGTMVETADGGGKFSEVVLRPRVTLRAGSNAEKAAALHERAHHLCFIANSVNFPVQCEAEVVASVLS
jgi:organic hydroperoxide reductase OsmC/OhrA